METNGNTKLMNSPSPSVCVCVCLCDVQDFESAGMGLLHFRSAVVSHLVKVNNATRDLLNLDKLKAEMGFQHPIIGVHIRHGDACHTTDRKGRCKGLAYYVPEIRTLAQR